jgi:cell division protein ZapA (FtsZ GTPase activity inhibitor)
MADPVRVEILGQVFSVSSEDDEAHVQQVAVLVDERMRQTMAAGNVVSSFTAAVLTALNVASECHKLKSELRQMEEGLDRLTARLASAGERETGE